LNGGRTRQLNKPFEIEQNAPNIHTVRFRNVRSGWEQWVLLSSDRHHDSAFCDQRFERKHLEEARARGALVLDFGDLFDAMQGKDDRRQSKDELRNENKRRGYLDSLVTTAAEFYGPYAAHFGLLGLGNHEASVLDKHGTNLTSLLAHRLRSEYGCPGYAGGYGGWVRFMFLIQKTIRTQIRLKYFHGAGGGGPVTRGVIQSNRQAVYLPDADIVVNGHTHDAWHVPIARERLTDLGVQHHDLQHHVRTATYKDEYRDGSEGWHVERGGAPKPIGAVWMRLYFVYPNRIECEFTQALRMPQG
jgi:hypothetical protein